MELILASASPRRSELLEQVGLTFKIVPAAIDEDIAVLSPEELVLTLAFSKAAKVADRNQDALVIAADTVVVVEDRILGKPGTYEEAEQMLALLSGREHKVITGVSVQCRRTGFSRTLSETTRVWFRSLSPYEIRAYIETGEPFDKAGAYGIQGRGALLVEKIEGCYFNVVGLPLNRVGLILREAGLELLGG